jgi:hypothetical protein
MRKVNNPACGEALLAKTKLHFVSVVRRSTISQKIEKSATSLITHKVI